MGLYRRFVLPRVIELACRSEPLSVACTSLDGPFESFVVDATPWVAVTTTAAITVKGRGISLAVTNELARSEGSSVINPIDASCEKSLPFAGIGGGASCN